MLKMTIFSPGQSTIDPITGASPNCMCSRWADQQVGICRATTELYRTTLTRWVIRSLGGPDDTNTTKPVVVTQIRSMVGGSNQTIPVANKSERARAPALSQAVTVSIVRDGIDAFGTDLGIALIQLLLQLLLVVALELLLQLMELMELLLLQLHLY